MKRVQAVNVGSRKHLLFDDALIAERRGFDLRMNPAVRSEEPVVVPDRPWETAGIMGDSGATVLQDGGEYKLWYSVVVPGSSSSAQPGRKSALTPAEMRTLDKKTLLDYLSDSSYMLCYATSRDGVHWEKPDLGIFAFAGSKKNNIVMVGPYGGTVFRDPTAPRGQRYKMITGTGPKMPHTHLDTDIPTYAAYRSIYGACSADGIHWRFHEKPVLPWYTDTTNVCYWDDRIRKYVAFVRWDETMYYRNGRTFRRLGDFYRAVGQSVSRDFCRFPPPKNILEPAPEDLRPAWKRYEIYNSSAIKYPFAADSYFMFPVYYHPRPEVSDIHLATSRDGAHYARWRDPFLGLGPAGAFDSHMVHMATGVVRNGDELNMYYVGVNYLHDIRTYPAAAGGIGRARVRLDGFVSQDARWTGGSLTTLPLRFSGRTLTLNMDASAGGCLQVEILDATGRPIPGFTRKETDRLWGNDVRKKATWNGKGDIAALRARVIRLRFIGRGVKLYAFQFV